MAKPIRYPFSHKIEIAWGDMDAFGHVNNVAYVRYFETARVEYFSQKKLWNSGLKTQEEGPVLTHLEMNYRKQVKYPAKLDITIELGSIASRSCEMNTSIWNEDGECILTGKATMIWVDFITGKPKSLPKGFDEIA